MRSYIHELYETIIFLPTNSYLPKSNDFYFIPINCNHDCVLHSKLTPKEYALCLESYFYCIKAVQGKYYHMFDKKQEDSQA